MNSKIGAFALSYKKMADANSISVLLARKEKLQEQLSGWRLYQISLKKIIFNFTKASSLGGDGGQI